MYIELYWILLVIAVCGVGYFLSYILGYSAGWKECNSIGKDNHK